MPADGRIRKIPNLLNVVADVIHRTIYTSNRISPPTTPSPTERNADPHPPCRNEMAIPLEIKRPHHCGEDDTGIGGRLQSIERV